MLNTLEWKINLKQYLYQGYVYKLTKKKEKKNERKREKRLILNRTLFTFREENVREKLDRRLKNAISKYKYHPRCSSHDIILPTPDTG